MSNETGPGITLVVLLMTVSSIVIALLGIISFTDIPDKNNVETIKSAQAITALRDSHKYDSTDADKILAHNQLREYQKISERFSNYTDSKLEKSIVYINMGDLDDAKKILVDVSSDDPSRKNQIWYTHRLVDINEGKEWTKDRTMTFEAMPPDVCTNNKEESDLIYNDKTCTLDELEQISKDVKILSFPPDYFIFNFHNSALPISSIQESLKTYTLYVTLFILVSFVTVPPSILYYIRQHNGDD